MVKRVSVTTYNAVRRDLQRSYVSHKGVDGWRGVAGDFGISKPMAYRIAVDGYEPKDPHIRAALGLPTFVPAPACQKCGDVHISKRCTKAAPKRVTKPRRDWKGLTLTLAGLFANGYLRIDGEK